jgi:multidrug efflux pump subunit AcrB
MVNLDSGLLQSKGLSPQDIVNTVNNQNVVAPSGTAKIDQFEYDVATNSAPKTVDEMNDLPVKVVGNSTIYLRDVSHVSDGFIPQTNIVRQDGHRGVLEPVIKDGDASTLSVVQGIRDLLPRVQQTLPPQLNIQQVGGPVRFRSGRHQRRSAGSRHRGYPHGADDPALGTGRWHPGGRRHGDY